MEHRFGHLGFPDIPNLFTRGSVRNNSPAYPHVRTLQGVVDDSWELLPSRAQTASSAGTLSPHLCTPRAQHTPAHGRYRVSAGWAEASKG